MASDIKFKISEYITCKNGLVLSIQCSQNHHCKPKNDDGPYTHVEVCSFDIKIPDWPEPICEYDRRTGRPILATYYNVPSQALLNLIYNMKGIVKGELPKLIL